jgi:hypothetical protein
MSSQKAWFLIALICVAVVAAACGTVLVSDPQIDFYSFWNSSRLIVEGRVAEVYGLQPSPVGELMPLAYPPPFLLFIALLGLIPFGLSFIVWVVGTGLLYVAASRAPNRVALGNPSAALNGFVGQNGFLTTAIMLFGLHALRSSPAMGGAILGLMIIKPHLALLLPVAIVAGRHWTAIPAAAASASALLVAAAMAFGLDAYRGFFVGRWPWEKVASVFALARWFGAGEPLAWTLHAGIALAAAGLVWRSWRQDWEAKIPILAAGSLLVSPYLFTYDAVLLVAPLAWLADKRPGWSLGVAGLSALPLVQAWGYYQGPSTTALAAIVSLGCMTRQSLHRDRVTESWGPKCDSAG